MKQGERWVKTGGSGFGWFWVVSESRLYIDVWQGTYGALQVVQLLVVICLRGCDPRLGIVAMLN